MRVGAGEAIVVVLPAGFAFVALVVLFFGCVLLFAPFFANGLRVFVLRFPVVLSRRFTHVLLGLFFGVFWRVFRGAAVVAASYCDDDYEPAGNVCLVREGSRVGSK